MNDYELAKSIIDRYAFTRKRTIEYLDKIGGVLPQYFNPYQKCSFKCYAPTLTTSCNRPSASSAVLIKEKFNMSKKYAIRKLTPVECFRLMGLTIEDAEKCRAVGMSDSALYKQAGNGIVTNCVQLLFEHLYKAQHDDTHTCMDEDIDYENTEAKNKQPLSANVLFSGVGMQDRGICNSNCWNLDVKSTSDIDKDAVVSYAAIHCGLSNDMIENYADYPSREQMVADLVKINLGYIPATEEEEEKFFNWERMAKRKAKDIEKYWLACKLTNNMGDISKIEDLPYADLWTYSFPCTDLSVAGEMKGMIKGKTRSGLLYEVERLLKSTSKDNLPKYLLLENVKNLVGKQFKPQFDEWCEFLENMGYNNYWQVINAKNCGIPQNRERVFVLSIRKDIDTGKFEFPTPFDNGMRLKDVLLEEVDEKYYITNERADALVNELVESGKLDEYE